MNPGSYSRLSVPAPPWLFRMVASHSEATDRLLAFQGQRSSGLAVRFLRGRKMTTRQEMFDEFAAALQFPYYFGNNWAAFDECLADLAWLPASGYVLTIFDCGELLPGDTAQLDELLEVLERTCVEWSTPIASGEAWDRSAVPFHIILHSTAEDVPRLPARIRAISDVI